MPDRVRATLQILVVSVGLAGFALTSHLEGLRRLAAAASLGAAAWAIWYSAAARAPVDRPSRTALASFSAAGIVLGASAGAMHRWSLGLPIWTGAIEPFVALACAIGAIEELVYRGWLWDRAAVFGHSTALIIAAVAHTSYKTALFVWPGPDAAPDLVLIAAATFGGGIVLGLLRGWSESVVPAAVAHAAFDFVVYRGVSDAPWWVWG
jgi:membrane protease YdiL (CAAX protease family)